MHHSSIFFGVYMQARGQFLPLRSLILPTRQIGVRRGQKWAFRVHHSTTFFSAFSCRRNATFCPCNPGFCPFWFSPFDVFSLQTLCFFERARRFAATDGNPLFFRASATFSCLCRKTIVFSGERNVFSIPRSLFLFRGRRQLPQAGEVRRP